MTKQGARYEPVAWWFTRKQIGRSLLEIYDGSKEMPPKLRVLIAQLDPTAEGDRRELNEG
jgi:hypothetical protein